MSFTRPCFIRKNTPELRKKLEEIGYTNCTIEGGLFLFTSRGIFDSMHTEIGLSDLVRSGLIDCDTNEPLFLAIVALRDDSDRMQWFVWGNRWMLWQYDCSPHCAHSTTGISSVFTRGRKATVPELIEHFKTEE